MSRGLRPTSAVPRLSHLNRKRNTRAGQTIHLLDVTPHEIVAPRTRGAWPA